jgi:hypothetical protein
MRRWQRAAIAVTCGRCAGTIAAGAPVLIMTLPLIRNRHYRCATCAEEPVPADLPEAHTPTPVPLAPRLGRLVGAGLPLDWKTRSTGDDREDR